MCTNLYNTKRALIRHYRAVHKRIPTRDMIQAKGDKGKIVNNIEILKQQKKNLILYNEIYFAVVVDHTPIEHLNLIEQKGRLAYKIFMV